jgi:hypothetical protein
MSKPRLSLADIQKEDEMNYGHSKSVQKSEIGNPKSDVVFPKIQKPSVHSAPKAGFSAESLRKPMAEMTKTSLLVSTEVFERLQDISRARRRANKPFKMTDLLREALADWLPKQEY